jgi:hypothetical protein
MAGVSSCHLAGPPIAPPHSLEVDDVRRREAELRSLPPVVLRLRGLPGTRSKPDFRRRCGGEGRLLI